MSTTTAFISYSHADDKALDRLHKHFVMMQRNGTLSAWTDRAVVPEATISDEISAHLDGSDLFIALLSPDYLASNYCYEKEFQRALKLARDGNLRIVPVILEPCDWHSSPIKDSLALPKDGQAVSLWTNQNNAFLNVVTELKRLLETSVVVNGGSIDGKVETDIAKVSKKPRLKQDFDSIQKSDFADNAFGVIKNYFRSSCDELNLVGDMLKSKFEIMDETAFTCSVVNRAKQSGGEAHITVTNSKKEVFLAIFRGCTSATRATELLQTDTSA